MKTLEHLGYKNNGTSWFNEYLKILVVVYAQLEDEYYKSRPEEHKVTKPSHTSQNSNKKSVNGITGQLRTTEHYLYSLN